MCLGTQRPDMFQARLLEFTRKTSSIRDTRIMQQKMTRSMKSKVIRLIILPRINGQHCDGFENRDDK